MQTITTIHGDIRKYNNYYSVKDVTTCIGLKQTKGYERKYKHAGVFLDIPVPTNGGMQYVKFMDVGAMCAILRAHNTQTCVDIGVHLQLDAYVVHDIRLQICEFRETRDIRFIMNCFANMYTMTKQYRVCKYRVDLYILEINTVVECDENDHRHYDMDSEEARTAAIDAAISPRWVRFNPDGDLSLVIQKILSIPLV